MGFSEEEIANRRLLDTEHDRRWETGLKYMQERHQVISTYEGAAQESRLDALRENYFQDEAETIAREEQEGFMRFKPAADIRSELARPTILPPLQTM
jgi:hypothetical protein